MYNKKFYVKARNLPPFTAISRARLYDSGRSRQVRFGIQPWTLRRRLMSLKVHAREVTGLPSLISAARSRLAKQVRPYAMHCTF